MLTVAEEARRINSAARVVGTRRGNSYMAQRSCKFQYDRDLGAFVSPMLYLIYTNLYIILSFDAIKP